VNAALARITHSWGNSVLLSVDESKKGATLIQHGSAPASYPGNEDSLSLVNEILAFLYVR
jgi:hypothetical protein